MVKLAMFTVTKYGPNKYHNNKMLNDEVKQLHSIACYALLLSHIDSLIQVIQHLKFINMLLATYCITIPRAIVQDHYNAKLRNIMQNYCLGITL